MNIKLCEKYLKFFTFLLDLPLQGFQFSVVTFLTSMIPAYEQAAYGIRAALPNSTASCKIIKRNNIF